MKQSCLMLQLFILTNALTCYMCAHLWTLWLGISHVSGNASSIFRNTSGKYTSSHGWFSQSQLRCPSIRKKKIVIFSQLIELHFSKCTFAHFDTCRQENKPYPSVCSIQTVRNVWRKVEKPNCNKTLTLIKLLGPQLYILDLVEQLGWNVVAFET